MSSEPPRRHSPHTSDFCWAVGHPRARNRSPSPLRGNVVPSPLPTRRTRTFSATVRASQGPVYKGVCKCFCRSKGHGFITPADGGPDIFLHISDVEESMSQWKATRSPIRCAPSHPRMKNCRLWRWSSPTWRQAPSMRPGPDMSSAPRDLQEPLLLGLGETLGEEEQGYPGDDIPPYKMGLQGGARSLSSIFWRKGVGGRQGCSQLPAQPPAIATSSHYLKSIKSI